MRLRTAPTAHSLLLQVFRRASSHASAGIVVELLVSVLAALIAGLGILSVLVALVVHNPDRMHLLAEWLPIHVSHLSRTLSVLDGICLVLLARGLRRRKRQAWLLTLILLTIFMPVHLLKDLDIEETMGAFVLGVLLLVLRRYYTVHSDPRTLRRGYLALGIAVLIPFVYSAMGMSLLRGEFQAPPGLWATITGGFNLLIGDSQVIPQTPRAVWFLHSTLWLSGVSLLYGIYAVLRPVLVARFPHDEERSLAAEYLKRYGVNPISPYALDDDKSIFVGPRGSGVIAFAVAAGMAMVVGDPIGPTARRDELLDAFIVWCRRQDWIPAFYEVMMAENEYYRKRGYRLLKVGEDAVIDLKSFTLSGKKIANVRHCVTHCERHGLSAQMYPEGTIDESTLVALERISAAWMSNKSGGEMGFSLGTCSRATLQKSIVAVARNAEGTPIAFATFRRFGGSYGVALDLMRRAAEVPSGTMDYLIAQALVYFQATGITVASLGLAPLANTREGSAHGWLENQVGNGMEWVFQHMNGVYRYKSLYFFKRKFNPQWEPRYLAYPGGVSLPHVLYALIRVHLPSALVSLPRLAWLPEKREAAVSAAGCSAPTAGGEHRGE